MELPPRARRIPRCLISFCLVGGTTSACAENTWYVVGCILCGWNYLRVRGEYPDSMLPDTDAFELPPRARRIPHVVSTVSHSPGTTSACAENTVYRDRGDWAGWNYLRVRGEYVGEPLKVNDFLELPPRARRIRHSWPHDGHGRGTTSACAENTSGALQAVVPLRNYLRVRGEYRLRTTHLYQPTELPPRARRIHRGQYSGDKHRGTTSACAENTCIG